MTELEALVSLNLAGDIGTIRLKRLLGYFKKPQDIFAASVEKLMAVAGIGRNIAERIRSFKKESLECELKLAKENGLEILTYEDDGYPENLKNISDPPIVLYVKGDIVKQDKLSLAVVGSRRASFYGLSNAEYFAAQLSGLGLTVVSGLARGIDTRAHQGALKSGGRTIAVMGSGFDHIYPAENKGLAEEITRSGAVVSEFPLDSGPLPQNFPRRNRIISGLSLGVLIIEAARNSGALITADFALEQGREVFALPGRVDSGTSFGTNSLIKQGAKLVSSLEDILEELKVPIKKELGCQEGQDNSLSPNNLGLDNEEGSLYKLLSGEPLLVDEIVEHTHMAVSRISNILFKLQLKKIVRQLPGKRFVRN